jgi:hypothetical protein
LALESLHERLEVLCELNVLTDLIVIPALGGEVLSVGGDAGVADLESVHALKCVPELGSLTIERMTIQRMEHVGIVVDDLAAATEFFVELGLVLQGEGSVEGRWVDRVVGLEGVQVDFAMMETPDSNRRLELVRLLAG